jgi:hypothetical protein
MDDIETLLDRIVKRVADSRLPDAEKAEIFAQIDAGLHHLVWPIVLSHVPEYKLKLMKDNPSGVTLDQYIDIITSAIQNPSTPKEIHDEIVEALHEVSSLVDKELPGGEKMPSKQAA